MAFNINQIRSQLALGGARASTFEVRITNPVNSVADIKVPFMVKAASLPSATLGTIELPYFGRKIKLAGDRTYDEWSTTVINDEDFLVKNALEEWNHAINTPQGNVSKLSASSPLQYKSQAEVIQYSKDGAAIRIYTFHGIWPSTLAATELGWETSDTIQEFEVTWQYDWWEVSGGVTGNAGGS